MKKTNFFIKLYRNNGDNSLTCMRLLLLLLLHRNNRKISSKLEITIIWVRSTTFFVRPARPSHSLAARARSIQNCALSRQQVRKKDERVLYLRNKMLTLDTRESLHTIVTFTPKRFLETKPPPIVYWKQRTHGAELSNILHSKRRGRCAPSSHPNASTTKKKNLISARSLVVEGRRRAEKKLNALRLRVLASVKLT